jgi:hypothetical protein
MEHVFRVMNQLTDSIFLCDLHNLHEFHSNVQSCSISSYKKSNFLVPPGMMLVTRVLHSVNYRQTVLTET